MTDETIFASALEKPDAAGRAAYLDSACKDDAEQRKRIDGLLAAHAKAVGFLDRPAVAPPEPGHAATRAYSTPEAEVSDGQTRTQGEVADEDVDDALAFLKPAGRPDSLGRIGHYEVLEVLGKGGFGIVYRAFDEVLQRVIAVKVLAPSMAATSPARKRFTREAQSAARIQHENVVRVHEVSRDDERLPYLVMEFVSGETLQQRLDRTGPLEVPEVVRLGRQIAEGLAAAHEKGLIHRDIKPSNILIDRGPHEHAKITDFGLARAADDASLTRSGVVAGTPMYMAPEQARGESLDHRADLFSLGSVMYAMLTGRPPFRAETTLAVLKRVAEDTPRPMREIIPEIPEWLCRIVEKLHAKDPAERFQTAKEVADVLVDCERQLQSHGTIKDRSRIPEAKPAPPRRARVPAWVIVVSCAAVVVLAAVSLAFPNMDQLRAVVMVLLVVTPIAVMIAAWPRVRGDGEAATSPREKPVPREYRVRGSRTALTLLLLYVVLPFVVVTSWFWYVVYGGLYFGDKGELILGPQEEMGAVIVLKNDRGEIDPDGGATKPITDWLDVRWQHTQKLDPGTYQINARPRSGSRVAEWEVRTSGPFGGSKAVVPGPSALVTVKRGSRVTVRAVLRPELPDPVPGPEPSSGFVPLFNGRDLTGWTTGGKAGKWRVVDGVLVGSDGPGFLFSEGRYRDFHLKVEARLAAPGNGGINFRETLQVELNDNPKAPTGSLVVLVPDKPATLTPYPHGVVPTDAWFTLEIRAVGTEVWVRVNTNPWLKKTVGAPDPAGSRFGLEVLPGAEIHFRKIAIKELSPEPPPAAVAPFDAAKAKGYQEAWARHLGVPVEYENSVGMKLRLIPAGEFVMGSNPKDLEAVLNDPELKKRPWAPDWVRAEGPPRRVTVKEPFYLGAHEVTVGQFRQFAAAKKYKTFAEKNGGGTAWNPESESWSQSPRHVWNDAEFLGSESHPVGFMTLADAKAFCAWLGERDGLRYVVPTEQQWEFACRAGTTTPWSFGDDAAAMEQHGWTAPHAGGDHHPVGRLAANPFGLFDLHGNAREITLGANEESVDRGGEAGRSALWARSAARMPDTKKSDGAFQRRGFRVAVVGDLKPKTPQPAVAPFDAAKAKEHQEAWARHLGVKVEDENSIGMKFRLIPPGEFLMGSAPDDHEKSLAELKKHGKSGWFFEFVEARSGPQRAVRLTRPYYLGAHEVTVGDFRRFVKETGYRTLAEQNAGNPYWEKPVWKAELDPRHPVTYLAWEDANAFCDWLGRKDGRTYRLPTEAEWEFACRAGTTTRWSWGDDRAQFLRHAWFSRPLSGGLGRVGEKTPNAFGLFDMHGNAEEWCADWHHPMLTVTPTDPHRTEQKDATGRVVRGGFGFDIPELGRSGRRSFAAPGNTTGIAFGFRVVAVGDLKSKPPASDKERLQGVWVGESAESLGIPLAADKVKQMRMEFVGGNVRVAQPGKPENAGTFKLDPDANPKEIDAISNEDQGMRGIYKLDGDKLTICMGEPGPKRPSEFRTGPDTGPRLLVTLRRATAADTPAPKQPDPAVIQPLKDAVAAHTRTLEAVKVRYEAGIVSKIELRNAEGAVTEARITLAEAEGDAASVAARLEDLVKFRQEERDLVAERFKAGVEPATVLNQADARLADAKARLAKTKPATVPKVTPAAIPEAAPAPRPKS